MRPRVLDDFRGHWRVTKRIRHANQPEAHFEGTAEWSPDEHGLLYHEQGVLQINGQPPMQGSRRYVWHANLDVYFEDGRFFHAVPPEGGQAHHQCAPDDYYVTYSFNAWPQFRATWRILGPRKDYLMEINYKRIAA